ncbi:S8 family serine peptidase [Dactylosporangium roseum]|uniref:S8 family serine peptidase n=1 Tax=Dactylosporangium roseum TaxID=47989 RepID=A0ABY5ZGZ7_9ACTN|nr:S8 family serine peptidase [Dactylosporangium roseum]UWZ39539.1 S8 family serine peptidase [Dactylosporangium roseum]
MSERTQLSMDPALWEDLAETDTDRDRVIEAIIRLARPDVEVPDVRMVSRFGAIATCRVPASEVLAVRAHPNVISLKAARSLSPGIAPTAEAPAAAGPARATDVRRDPQLAVTGRGVVVAAVDWGVDVDAAALRLPPEPDADDVGGTRFLALWDQRDRGDADGLQPYGYGTVHDRAAIDAALRDPRPYERLGYHPAIADRGTGTHGMHVLDIAAGNGRGGGPVGIAPEADLVFVHLADRDTGGLANLGDSVRLLEAVDFVARTAGARPWVVNVSVGRHGGPHDGATLVELAFDALLAEAPGRFIVQSAGNYYQARTHASGTLRPGETRSFSFVTEPGDATLNELEIWYGGDDEFVVRIDPPGYTGGRPVRLGERADVRAGGRVIGRIYHRDRDPNNGLNHVDAFLYPVGLAGTWTVTLEARRVVDGRFDAWLERDDVCRPCQARFTRRHSSPTCTTGTIANSRLPLVVGAYNGHDPARPVAPFSSAGPTRDGRCKPDVGAPGSEVLAGRSAAAGTSRNAGLLVRKSGTSMAAPHVTGALALSFSLAGHQLTAREIRSAVLASCDPPRSPDPDRRLGCGYLNVPKVILTVRRALAAKAVAPGIEESTMDFVPTQPALPVAPAIAYREYIYRPFGSVAHWIEERYAVVCRPGRCPDRAPRPGDVLIEVALGWNEPGRCTVLDSEALDLVGTLRWLSQGQLILRPLPGLDAGAAYATDAEDRTRPLGLDREPDPPDQTFEERGCGCGSTDSLRDSFGEDAGPSDPGPWKGTAEQEDFRSRVLAAHIARSRMVKGAPQRDLREDELSDVPGTCRTKGGKTTCVRTATATAEAARRLLEAANSDLAAARKAGDADALRTVKVTAASGYRGSDHQKGLWLGYFATKYYDRTRAARAKIADGPHSDAAVDYMLRPKGDGGYGIGGRIAAPGFSNHQGGIAIDLWQDRIKGNEIFNDSDDPSRCRWRQSWFHGWLRTHAAAYGFQPIATEEWHWEYRPGIKATADLTDHRGGKLWTFASRTLPQPVAVFCPKAALGRRDVDLLIFAHGLLRGCTRPKRVPAGFVTDAPFELGRIVDASGQPVVLVVPLLDWGNPCGEVVFGRGHTHWHPLGKPAVLNAVVNEVLTQVGAVQGVAAPSLRELAVAGHSRAYDVLEPLAASRTDTAMGQGALARLSQVWAFDTTYAGDVAAWTDWLRLNPSLQLYLYYRPGSKTGTIGDRFYAQRSDRLFVTKVKEVHCAVPATRLTELMSRPAAATGPGEEESHEATHDADLEPFDAGLTAVGGLTDVEDLDTFDTADAEAALDPDLSATLGLEGAGSEYSEDFDDIEDFGDRVSDDEVTLETSGSR